MMVWKGELFSSSDLKQQEGILRITSKFWEDDRKSFLLFLFPPPPPAVKYETIQGKLNISRY